MTEPSDQSGRMDAHVVTDDDGGVHLTSGIPNRAFYELAIRGDTPGKN